VINILGLGVGGRAGVSFFNAYLGASFMYYLAPGVGSNGSQPGVVFSEGDSTLSSILYGAEVGYGFTWKIVTIRPQVGLGNYVLRSANSTFNRTLTVQSIYVEPGATLEFKWSYFLLGLDANALVLPQLGGPPESTGQTVHPAFTFHGQVGLAF
jgi:hypothetical protein